MEAIQPLKRREGFVDLHGRYNLNLPTNQQRSDCKLPHKFVCPDFPFAGACVDSGYRYRELTERCKEASQDDISGMITSYQEGLAAEANLATMSDSPDLAFKKKVDEYAARVKKFCDRRQAGSKYDACNDLEERLEEIMGNTDYMGPYTDPNYNAPPRRPTGGGGGNGQTKGWSQRAMPSMDPNIMKDLQRCRQILKDKVNVRKRDAIDVLTAECADANPTFEAGNLRQLENTMETVNREASFGVLAEESATLQIEEAARGMINIRNKMDSSFDCSDKKQVEDHIKEKFWNSYKRLSREKQQRIVNAAVRGCDHRKKIKDRKKAIQSFDSKVNEINQLCNQLHKAEEEYQYGKKGLILGWIAKQTDNWHETKKERRVRNEEPLKKYWENPPPELADMTFKQAINTKITELIQGEPLSSLIGMAHYRDNHSLFDDDYISKCANDPNAVLFKPIGENDYGGIIDKSLTTMESTLDEKINGSALKLLLSGNVGDKEEQLKDLLKNDPFLITAALTQIDKGPNAKPIPKDMGAYLCKLLSEIYDSDRKRRNTDRFLTGAGIFLGGLAIALSLEQQLLLL